MRFLLIVILGLMTPFSARAQDTLPPSEAEDVAIAFFRTGGLHPDYNKWAKGGKAYKVAAPALADEVLQKEKQRLMTRYRTYDPETDLLRVRAEVRVSLHAGRGAAGADGGTGGERLSMTLAFGGGEVTYFPYKFQDYDIAVIPQNMDSLLDTALTRAQFDLISAAFKDGTDGVATLDLDMRPARSYIQQPYPLDGRDQWMMLADPVSLSLRSNAGVLLWSYGADWYVSPQTKAVRTLYRHDGAVPAAEAP